MFKTEYTLDVRYYETDTMGIVHHSNYLRYFECGRNQMMKELGIPIEVLERAGVMLPVVKVEICYKAPAYMGDSLKIVTTVNREPLAKIVLEQQIFNQKDELICYGAVTVGFIDSVTRRPVRVPQLFAEKIAPFFTNGEKKL
ncbi:MAG: acyl-CoA thioesterase [Bacteroidales bacterium]|nr:acyl-CoA thioesterase [Bacteroidales bacterium]